MAEYFISPSGNDTTGNGSESTPWLTFAKFLSSSASGDTCICAAGTYTWATATIAGRIVRGPAVDNPAVFDGAAAAVKWTISGGSTFENIEFTNAVSPSAQTFFQIATSSQIEFTSCRFIDLVWNGGANDGFVGPSVAGATPAMAVRFSGCLFNDVVANTGSGRILFSQRAGGSLNIPLTMEFFNCILYFGSTSPTTFSYLFNEHEASLELLVIMTNTIIANATGATLTWMPVASFTNTLTNCTFHNITSVPSGTGNITSDPLVYDAASGNFNLRPTSPAISAGTLV